MEPIAGHLAIILHDPALAEAFASRSAQRHSSSIRLRLNIGKALRALAAVIEPRSSALPSLQQQRSLEGISSVD